MSDEYVDQVAADGSLVRDRPAAAMSDALARLRQSVTAYEQRRAMESAKAAAERQWRDRRSSFKNPDTLRAYGGRKRGKKR